LPVRQRNRPEEAERKNDPTPRRCTLVYTCAKNAQIVQLSPTLWHAQIAFQAAQLEPHMMSSQGDPIRPVDRRGTTNLVGLPPAFVQRRFRTDVHLSDSSFILPPSSLQGMTPKVRIHGVSVIFHRTGEKRLASITSTLPPIAGMVQKQVTAQGGWGRRPQGDAQRSEGSALRARSMSPARPQPPGSCHLRGC
jgi:hypothetical protein